MFFFLNPAFRAVVRIARLHICPVKVMQIVTKYFWLHHIQLFGAQKVLQTALYLSKA